MIIIDENTTVRLIAALDEFLLIPDTKRCIHLALPQDSSKHTNLQEVITNLIQQEITAPDIQAYFCEGEGDVFVVAPAMSVKEAHNLARRLGQELTLPASEQWFSYYDLATQAKKIRSMLDERINAQRAKEQAIADSVKKQLQEAKTAQKRAAILAMPDTSESSRRISEQRSKRDKLEIMMIEDDAFSRRLVENVLGKSYKITGLGTADNALSTYVRIAPNIVFLDINLPNVTGHELLEKILILDPDAYVVMLSGNTDRSNIMHAMSHGAKGFIAKPFTRDKLLTHLERCVLPLTQTSS